ncbi:MAG TPA: TetR family transcriptional regulator [Acidimicrobiales bacterium]|nr:TetR family transcriptional regulator [Acidimicrobiales bacterium]
MRAAEHLFARQGIDGTTLREINRMAGQRNPSAVHYHFGSKQGLVRAILIRHQEVVEVEAGRRLDDLSAAEGKASVRDLIEAMVRPLCCELGNSSGRDFLRIVPPFITQMEANLRQGVMPPVTSESARLLRLLAARLDHLPDAVRWERLVSYSVVLSSLMAERARQLESREPTPLDAEQFVVHLLDVTEAVVTAPSRVERRHRDGTEMIGEAGL